MQSLIINFQAPGELRDLIDRYERDGLTNIDHILHFSETLGEWTVDKKCRVGDRVFFMCAKTSVDRIGHVCADARKYGSPEILAFAEEKRNLYKKYAGNIVAVGVIEDEPFQSEDAGYAYPLWKTTWYAKIGRFKRLHSPVHISEYRDYIMVSRTGSITHLSLEQSIRLAAQVEERNPMQVPLFG